jgi:hypothetical protein
MSRRQWRIKYVQDIHYGDGDDINDDDPGCVRNPRTGSDRPQGLLVSGLMPFHLTRYSVALLRFRTPRSRSAG